MMPIVFWASLAPWPKETAAADRSCRPLNALASSGTFQRRWIRARRSMAKNATLNATPGEATMAISGGADDAPVDRRESARRQPGTDEAHR